MLNRSGIFVEAYYPSVVYSDFAMHLMRGSWYLLVQYGLVHFALAKINLVDSWHKWLAVFLAALSPAAVFLLFAERRAVTFLNPFEDIPFHPLVALAILSIVFLRKQRYPCKIKCAPLVLTALLLVVINAFISVFLHFLLDEGFSYVFWDKLTDAAVVLAAMTYFLFLLAVRIKLNRFRSLDWIVLAFPFVVYAAVHIQERLAVAHFSFNTHLEMTEFLNPTIHRKIPMEMPASASNIQIAHHSRLGYTQIAFNFPQGERDFHKGCRSIIGDGLELPDAGTRIHPDFYKEINDRLLNYRMYDLVFYRCDNADSYNTIVVDLDRHQAHYMTRS